MKKMLKKIGDNEISRFLVIGGCATAIDFMLYLVISLKVSITFSKGIAMIVSSIFSYFANKIYTFDNRDKSDTTQVIKFYLVFVTNFFTNLSVNYLIYSFSGYKIVAFMIATICGMSVNYVGQKFLVFKKVK